MQTMEQLRAARTSSELAPGLGAVWSARVRSLVVRLWSAICKTRQMQRAMDELEGLDDRMLKDIGICRCEIRSIVRYGRFH